MTVIMLAFRQVIGIDVFGGGEEHVFEIAAPAVFVETPEGMPDLQIANEPNFVTMFLYLRRHVTIFKHAFRFIRVSIQRFQHSSTVGAVTAVKDIFLRRQTPYPFGLLELIALPGNPVNDGQRFYVSHNASD